MYAEHLNFALKNAGQIFVENLQWITSAVFLELLGLAQCLPGPTSTQVSFALGVVQKGVSGGLLSGILFQYPGFLIASLCGAGVANFLRNPKPWLRGLLAGLSSMGVALVASAAKSLTFSTCKDRVTMVVNAVAAVVSFYYPVTWIFPALILAGGLTTLVAQWKVVSRVADADRVERLGVNRWLGVVLIFLWAAVLATVITLRHQNGYVGWESLYWFEAFYRTGSIIFGGGQVVLPLLQNEVVATGWMSLEDYLTGFALVQAMPGPLFNIAAYLGAIIAFNAKASVVGGIFNCWVALFAPGIILIYGFMPWWGVFRNFQIYRRMLPGASSAAVGLIVSAVFNLTFQIYKASPFPNTTICIGIIGFCLVDFVGCPAALAVFLGGVLGVIGWAAHMH